MRYSRRAVISILFGSYGCSSVSGPAGDLVIAPLISPKELFTAGLFPSLRFHQNNVNEQERFSRTEDMWADSEFVQKAAAVIRYEYRRRRGAGNIQRTVATCCDLRWPLNTERKDIAESFLSVFERRTPKLAARLRQGLDDTMTSGTVGSHMAFVAADLVGEVELTYHVAREATYVTIGFYERNFYGEEFQSPNGPLPQQLAS